MSDHVIRVRKCRWAKCCWACGGPILISQREVEAEPGHWIHRDPCWWKEIDLDRLAASAVPSGVGR